MNELAKLRWQCRRGMKELDLLLENYLANDYLLADATEQARFVELLALEDDELLTILTQSPKRAIASHNAPYELFHFNELNNS